MPSIERRAIRRTRGGYQRKVLATRTLTPHTVAISDKFLFVLARTATDNYIIRVPTRAILKLVGLPWNHAMSGEVLDIDPNTTDYQYDQKVPEFMREDGHEE